MREATRGGAFPLEGVFIFMDPHPRILIISPSRDEAGTLPKTIHSLANQTLPIASWVIVNDGSKDDTGKIADEAAQKYPWISVVHRPVGQGRRVGPGVIEAFYAGLQTKNLADYDFVVKLDADLEFQPRYFEILMERFKADPKLGTASGKAYIPVGDTYVYERTGDDFSHGVAKLYRRECFEDIGGFVPQVMWDGIDCHKCRMKGWKAVSYHEPELKIIHLRQMGSSHKSVYHGRMRWGRGQYFMGTHPLYILAVSIYRMAERPWILGGICILLGYMQAWWEKMPQYDDPEFRKWLRAWQMNKLFGRS